MHARDAISGATSRLGWVAAYVLGAGLAYLPKFVVGTRPPAAIAWLLAGLLAFGAWVLLRAERLDRAWEWLERSGWRLTLTATGAAILAASAFIVFQYHRFVVWVDSPKFTQALWLVLQGQGIRPVLGMDVSPQTHVTPTMLLLLPWYALVPSHLAFLMMRNVLLAGAAVPLFLAARTRLPQGAAFLLALAYLVNFPIVYHLTNGYHELQLFPLLFFLACWCFERRWYAGWIASLVLIGGIREEMGFVVLGFAVLAAIRRRSPKYWLGAGVVGCAWLAVSYELILGLSQGAYHYADVYPTPAGLGRALLTRENAVYLYQIGLPFLFVLPVAGWSWLPILPVLLGNLAVNYPLAKAAFLQYSLPVVAGGYYAVACHLGAWTRRMSPQAARTFLGWVLGCGLTLGITQTAEHWSYERTRVPFGGAVGVPVAGDSLIAKDPRAFQAWVASLEEASRRVPEGCRASVPPHVIAHLSHQRGVLDYGYGFLETFPEYILVDANTWYPDHAPRLQRLKKIVAEAPYVVDYQQHGVVLYVLAGHQPSTPCLTGPLTHARPQS